MEPPLPLTLPDNTPSNLMVSGCDALRQALTAVAAPQGGFNFGS